VARVAELGGFGFLSHPFSKGSNRFRRGIPGMPWRALDCGGYVGLELWSFLTDSAEQLDGFRDIVRFIADPEPFLDHPPRSNLEQWDRICAERTCVGLAGVDAHQVGLRIANRVPLRLMSYRRSFRFLHTHLLLEREPSGDLTADRQAVYDALRAGRAYMCRESLAPAHGFRFWCEGDALLPMGSETVLDGGAPLLRVRLPRPARVQIVCGGAPVAEADGVTSLEHRAREPGVYRVEVYLTVDGRERTWVLSNPIYLRARTDDRVIGISGSARSIGIGT